MGIGAGAGAAAAAGIGAAGSIAGSAINAGSASSAAGTQAAQAAASAANLGKAGETAQGFYNPYVAGGTAEYQNMLADPTFSNVSTNYLQNAYDSTTQASNENNSALGTLGSGAGILNNLAAGGITAQSIQNLPGYAAINALGQEGVTNSAAARGLANSGAALKGAANYATTMADQSYQNLYQDQLGTAQSLDQNAQIGVGAAQNQLGVANNYLGVNNDFQGNVMNTFNRENSLAGAGLTASTDSAANALTAAGASNAYGAAGANALAAGQIGTGNALSSGLGNAANSYQQYALYSQLLNGGGNSNAPQTYAASDNINYS